MSHGVSHLEGDLIVVLGGARIDVDDEVLEAFVLEDLAEGGVVCCDLAPSKGAREGTDAEEGTGIMDAQPKRDQATKRRAHYGGVAVIGMCAIKPVDVGFDIFEQEVGVVVGFASGRGSADLVGGVGVFVHSADGVFDPDDDKRLELSSFDHLIGPAFDAPSAPDRLIIKEVLSVVHIQDGIAGFGAAIVGGEVDDELAFVLELGGGEFVVLFECAGVGGGVGIEEGVGAERAVFKSPIDGVCDPLRGGCGVNEFVGVLGILCHGEFEVIKVGASDALESMLSGLPLVEGSSDGGGGLHGPPQQEDNVAAFDDGDLSKGR